ncbi:hypothetical protein ACFSKN_04785 [Mariniflexile gromovii]|uniref:Uncharacterized protein n=1 Tax=Mariniflexile gromovii TaxID=362523 RepID=A0ABS4BW67_9FLAO|nr:hypothetical protein [Mariniflexile gromovii]MBP0904836.1 hypothetical protein [Mariniflexile gromovii]
MSLELEFDDVKKLRKSLLVASVVGIFLAKLVKYSKEDTTIDFLGFSLPIGDATFLPNYIGYLIIFFIIALIIRYSNDTFKKEYEKTIKIISNERISPYEVGFNTEVQLARNRLLQDFNDKIKLKANVSKVSVFILDIIFPIVLGIATLIIIFFKL